jgi:ACS family hexuronate transporter-like MFS transporter
MIWIPTISMMLVSLISYIDRNTLALLAPTILAQTGMSAQDYGYVISAFSIAYMIGNPAWGFVLDRYGVRSGMIAAVAIWTTASAAHAMAGGMAGFAAARALLGFGEGATFPGGLRTAVQTLPASSQSRGIAVAYSGGSLGAIVTPIIITPVALLFGWRGAFWFTGLIGVCWVVLWLFVSRRIPPPEKKARTARPLRLGDRRLWAFMSSYALGGLPLAFVIYGAAIYLSRVHGFTQADLGRWLWVPPLGWEVGYFFWGWIADRFVRSGRLSFAHVLGAAAVLSMPLAVAAHIGPVLLMTQLFFAMFVAAGFVILSVAYATQVFSSEHSGVLAGAGAGSWSAVVAVVMPLFGRLFDQQAYAVAFALAAIFPLAGYGIWLALAHQTRS